MPRKPVSSKVCPSCGILKARADYYRKGSSISFRCRDCTLTDNASRASKYIGRYTAYQNDWRSTRYRTDPEYRDRIAKQKKAAYERRKDAMNRARRDRWANDPTNPQRLYYRRKDVKCATPPWTSKADLLAFYAACPKGMEVDHIIPIKGLIDGRAVCGLHVPWNLQYLTPTQNRQKKNRITESDITHHLSQR